MNRYLGLLPPSRHFCHVCDRNSHAIAMKASLKQQWIRRKRIIHGIAYQNSHDSHACHTMAYQVHLARSFDDTPAILLDTAEMSHVVHPLHLSSRLWQQQNGVWEKKVSTLTHNASIETRHTWSWEALIVQNVKSEAYVLENGTLKYEGLRSIIIHVSAVAMIA